MTKNVSTQADKDTKALRQAGRWAAVAILGGALTSACSSSSSGNNGGGSSDGGSSSGSDAASTGAADSGSSGGSSSSGGGGSSSSGGEGGTVVMTGVGCNSVALTGSPITPTSSTSTAPTPAGGAIASGTYALTSAVQYVTSPCVASVSGVTVQSTIVVNASSSTVQVYSVTSFQGTTEESRSSGTYATSGTDLTTTPTCGEDVDAGAGTPSPYTATPTTVTVFSVDSQGLDAGACQTTVETYTQP